MTANIQTETSIPAELLATNQWVAWRYKAGPSGGQTKVPVSPHNAREASVSRPESWGTFQQARERAAKHVYAGVGFVFTEQDAFAGIDLDKCRNPESGVIEDWAQTIIRDLDSYTELSPSGTGVHILLRAKVEGRKRIGKIEMYDRGRFFTVSGAHLKDTPLAIEARQGELDTVRASIVPPIVPAPPVRLHPAPSPAAIPPMADDDLIRRAKAARNGATFSALMDGDTSNHGDDDSAADLALLNLLAWWSGPNGEDQVDRIFRTSGLMRPKWDERRGTQTYGEISIATAMRGRTEFYAASSRPPLTLIPRVALDTGEVLGDEGDAEDVSEPSAWDQFMSRRVNLAEVILNGIEPPQYLVHPILLEGKVACIFGGPEQGKTMLLLHLILQVIRAGKRVMMLDEEVGIRETAERLEAMGATDDDLTRLYYFPFALDGSLDDMAPTILEGVKRDTFALVALDSLSKALSAAGLNEQDNADCTKFMRAWVTPASHVYGASVVYLDHTGKVEDDGSYSRGASSKLADTDLQWHIKATVPPGRDSMGRLVLTKKKDRTATVPTTIRYNAGGDGTGAIKVSLEASSFEPPVAVVKTNDRDCKALTALLSGSSGEGKRYGEWRTASVMSESTFERTVKRLRDAALVDRDGDIYRATATGTQMVERRGDENLATTTPIHPQTTPTGVGGGGA